MNILKEIKKRKYNIDYHLEEEVGAGVKVSPVAFLIIQNNNNVKLLPVDHTSAIDKLLDYMPDLVEKTNNLINKSMNNKKEEQKYANKRYKNKNKRPIIENNYEFEYNEIEQDPEEFVEESED